MTRVKKIDFLIHKGEDVRFHFNQYRNQRRLIIEQINEIKYHNTTADQMMAGEVIDLMYWEYNKN